MTINRLFLWGALFFLVFTFHLAKANNPNENTGTHPHRLFHFVLRGVALEDAKWMVDRAHKYGFNGVVVTVTDGVELNKSPWKPLKNAWSREELIDWINYAKKHGMEVIPEIKLLTHQEKFLQKAHPALMYNFKTYNPLNAQVYNIVYPFLDEIIEIFNPSFVHIGHDEVVGHNEKARNKLLKNKELMLPADLYLMDILKIHKYLTNKGINTAMWGDMLLSSDEFPNMKKNHLHGGKTGYGKLLRQKLPKDILIFDWHYFGAHKSFPSLKALQDEGFKVVGSTWKNKKTTQHFSRYASEHKAYGMLATTWWHVQKKEWEKVDLILKESGNIFFNP